MVDMAVKEEALAILNGLPHEKQADLLRILRTFASAEKKELPGAPGSEWAKLAGILSPEAADEIERAIEEGFERVPS